MAYTFMSVQSAASTVAVGAVDDVQVNSKGGAVGVVTVLEGEEGEKGRVDAVVGGEGRIRDLSDNERDIHPEQSVHVDTGALLIPKGKTVTRVMAHVPLGIVTQTAIYILRRRTLPLS